MYCAASNWKREKSREINCGETRNQVNWKLITTIKRVSVTAPLERAVPIPIGVWSDKQSFLPPDVSPEVRQRLVFGQSDPSVLIETSLAWVLANFQIWTALFPLVLLCAIAKILYSEAWTVSFLTWVFNVSFETKAFIKQSSRKSPKTAQNSRERS